MTERTGTISVQTADIFPIIKKWLYSEHDIFLRELIANATDAITKRNTLARTRNMEIAPGKVEVRVDAAEKVITITDNGLGMTEEEVEKYLAQLAFSGAEEFVKKLEKDKQESDSDIIGKFGLGFYSAFMVAKKVEVETLSMDEGSVAVKWTCEGETDYKFSSSDKSEIGTKITLHIDADSEEFLNEGKLSEVLRQYCDFMPYPIDVLDLGKTPEKPKKDDGTIDEDAEPIAPTPVLVNNTEPLWNKDPSTLKDEDYIAFFKQLYPYEPDPLFWIHLKVDHPFTLNGILYFPKIQNRVQMNERNIRLYCRQVFVSDDVKNIIPDFLSLLRGTIDSTDIPLNVSRSSLQGDPNVKKISNYIIKKVAESLKKLFKTDRQRFEEIWGDIGLFVKYGVMSDSKFDELMRERVIFKNSSDKFVTFSELRESIPEEFKEKLGDKILYCEKDKTDHVIKEQLREKGVEAIESDNEIDPHFLSHVETRRQGDTNYQFASIDNEVSTIFGTENASDEDFRIKELFEEHLITSEKEKEIEIQKISNSKSMAYFKIDEQMKRFQKMAKSMGHMPDDFKAKKTLVINPANPIIKNAMKIHEKGGHEDLVEKLCHHVEDLASISSTGIEANDREKFVVRSQALIQELTDLAL